MSFHQIIILSSDSKSFEQQSVSDFIGMYEDIVHGANLFNKSNCNMDVFENKQKNSEACIDMDIIILNIIMKSPDLQHLYFPSKDTLTSIIGNNNNPHFKGNKECQNCINVRV